MAKTDKCVVRNEGYSRDKVGNMERHNERKNERYGNGDVQLDRSALNVHFKECEDGYVPTFDKLVADGVISTRGLQKNAKIIDEMIFDVNTEYFERNGGYEYAKEFFTEAYRMAVKEAGGEEYVLSAVMHADERNKALSEKLGHDVYHYHLHVVYIPVVDKEILWTKRCKDPALVGTVKNVIKQVSNSKKWASEKVMGEDGKERLVYSYSLLQDRYFEHMRAAGFTDFQRGERGSTTEHLDALDYKIQQDEKRLDVLESDISDKENTAAVLDKKAEKKQERIDKLDEKISVKKQTAAEFADIDSMAKKTIGGNYQLPPADWKSVSDLAKEGVKSRGIIKMLRDKITSLMNENAKQKKQLERYGEGQSITDTLKYHQAKQRSPRRMMEVITDILRKPPEQSEPEKQQERKRKGMEL